MDDEKGRESWLEIEGHKVSCPRQERRVPLHECLGCARFASLAMDPKGEHIYIDCNREAPAEPAHREASVSAIPESV